MSRRDPSKVIRVGDTYYIWYIQRRTAYDPVGLRNCTNDMPDDVLAWDWDLADIYYAASKDGFDWTEHGDAVSRSAKGEYADRSRLRTFFASKGNTAYITRHLPEDSAA